MQWVATSTPTRNPCCCKAAELYGEEIILVGDQELLTGKLNALNTKKLPVRIVHAPDVLEMGDKAVTQCTEEAQ
jgi:fatty acid/phospholipid biosynthesis enzyme